MKRRNNIWPFLLAYLFFCLGFAVFIGYEAILKNSLNLSSSVYQEQAIFFSWKELKELYPRFYMPIFVGLKISQFKLLVLSVLAFGLSILAFRKYSNKAFAFQFFILFTLFVVLEILTSTKVFKAQLGITFNNQYLNNSLAKRPKYTADELGIYTFLPGSDFLPVGYRVNKQGFRSAYEFDSLHVNQLRSSHKVLMFVGDSHTEGSWVEPVSKCFADLIDQKSGVAVLNFGKSGADPLQYQLIIDKYLDIIRPDLVIIPLCFENDFMTQDRMAQAYKAPWVHTNYSSLSNLLPNTHPDFRPDTYFNSWQELKSYYLYFHSILGERESIFEQLFIKGSALNQSLYFLPKIIQRKINQVKSSWLASDETVSSTSYSYLQKIQERCLEENIPFLLVGIPSIQDIAAQSAYGKYSLLLKDLKIEIPLNLTLQDYISFENDHFTKSGHLKFANFLDPLIDSTLTYNHLKKESEIEE